LLDFMRGVFPGHDRGEDPIARTERGSASQRIETQHEQEEKSDHHPEELAITAFVK
jgi:hypothetical protein